MASFIRQLFLGCTLLPLFLLRAEEPVLQPGERDVEIDIKLISESFGHLIAKNLEALQVDFDIPQLIRGIQNGVEKQSSPMAPSECIHAITLIQERLFKAQSEKNLLQANRFMEENSRRGNVHMVEGESALKIHYTIDQEGTGTASVQEHSIPKISYSGALLDGTVFGEGNDEILHLDEMILGFKALVGMKKGEKRTLYIHPDLGYGESGELPPNSLLIFQVEVKEVEAHGELPSPVHSSTEDLPH